MSDKLFTVVFLTATALFAIGIGGCLISAAADLVAYRAAIG